MARLRDRSTGLYGLVGADALEATETGCVTPDLGYQLGHLQGAPGPCPDGPCSFLDCYRRRVAAFEAGRPITVASSSLPRGVHWSWRDLKGLLVVSPDGTVRLAEGEKRR